LPFDGSFAVPWSASLFDLKHHSLTEAFTAGEVLLPGGNFIDKGASLLTTTIPICGLAVSIQDLKPFEGSHFAKRSQALKSNDPPWL